MPFINPDKYGVSFSSKQCANFGVDAYACLRWLIHDVGLRRFRLMSYWNDSEKTPGQYDFSRLDWQIAEIEKVGGRVTLCLGARQPRWPENHWPDWAWALPKPERSAALLTFIENVVQRYKNRPVIISYQLENEALLKSFGRRPEVDRQRLRNEFALIKRLDPSRPIIMSTSTSWGVPFRRPIPDVVGFLYYHTYFNSGDKRYHKAGGHYVLLHRFRGWLIKQLLGRETFIHELQCEPWGPSGIWNMSIEEQDKSMSPALLTQSFQKAQATRLGPIDLWGGEWWYWRSIIKKEPTIFAALLHLLKNVSEEA